MASVLVRNVGALVARRSNSRLVKALDDPKTSKQVFEKLISMGHKYKGYVKYAGGTGGALGLAFSAAHMADVSEERKVNNKECLAYPIAGAIGGGLLGVTAPVWIIFAPVGYVFGYDNVATIAKIVLTGVLLGDDSSPK